MERLVGIGLTNAVLATLLAAVAELLASSL